MGMRDRYPTKKECRRIAKEIEISKIVKNECDWDSYVRLENEKNKEADFFRDLESFI